MLWLTRAEGLWRKSGRRRKVIAAFGARHFVDLNVADGEDSTTVGAGDTTLQPLIINTPGDRDHLALRQRRQRRKLLNLSGVRYHASLKYLIVIGQSQHSMVEYLCIMMLNCII